MSDKRRVKYRFTEKGKCRWCGVDVKKPRRCWCSDTCVHEFNIRNDAGYIRWKVYERDRGICVICKLDTVKFKKDFCQFFHSIPDRTGWNGINIYSGLKYKISGCLSGSFSQTFWEADHIVPVVEGGLEIGMDNLRTLCRFCHKAETAKLAARLAEKRKADKLEQQNSLETDR